MKKLSFTALFLMVAAPAMAHPGHDLPLGLMAGLAHPLTGADHLAAMLAVGIWSGIAMPRRPWAGAAAFLAAMLAGAALGLAGAALPLVEAGIVLSVVVFGLMVLMARAGQGGAAAALALIAGFALLHGHAHASAAGGAAPAHLAGFLGMTAALHLVGIAIARATAGHPLTQKLIGGAIIASGLMMAAG